MKYDYKYFTKIFEPLGYYVFNRNLSGPDSEWFDLYVKDSNRGMEWFGGFSPIYLTRSNGKTELIAYKLEIYNNYEVYEPEEVITQIKSFNSSRILPSYCYSPTCRPFANIQDAFLWYMKSLGFETPRWDEGYSSWTPGKSESSTMILRNMYGEVISKITCYIDDRDDPEMKGSICRFIGKGWSWVESKYKGLDEMIGAINSIIEPEILINAATALNTSKNMTDDRSDNISLTKVNKSGDVYILNAKNAIKIALQNALDKLD